jgi:hypothetical protein
MSRHSGESQDCERGVHPFSLSPLRHPCHHGGERIIIEHVIEKSSLSIVYPTLTRSNYTEWSLVMKVNLQAVGLWDMIDSGATAMTTALSPRSSVLCHRRCKQDLRLRIWHTTPGSRSERCSSVQIGSRKQNAERLRWEFGEHTFKLGKTVEDFSIRLNNVVGDLRVLGDVVSDKEVIKHMLHAVPERLEQVAISMETLLDLDSLSIE